MAGPRIEGLVNAARRQVHRVAETLGAVKSFQKPFPYQEFLAAVKGALGDA